MAQELHVDTDVLIVGGGLAGCALAYLLASKGKDVLILERQDASTKSKLCAGVFDTSDGSVDAVFGAGFLERVGARAYPCARATSGQEEPNVGGNIICVERKALDDAALCSCKEAGARVVDCMHIESIDFEGHVVWATDARSGEHVSVAYSTLVGADGAASQVRRLATGKKQRVVPSVQCTVATDCSYALMEQFEDAVGYCWHFPFSPTQAYVGACAYSPMATSQLKLRLQAFCARRGYELGELKGAPIPSGDDVLLSAGRDVWLVGDAAGLTAAGIGCGMGFACASANALAQCVLEGSSYQDAMNSLCAMLDATSKQVYSRVDLLLAEDDGVHNAAHWLNLLDKAGAGPLAPQQCRKNLLAAQALLAPCTPSSLHFAEFPLLGEPGFDMTWSVCFDDVMNAQGLPPELEGAQRLARDMDPDGIFMFEYDTSKPQLPPAGFYFKGKLANGGHAIGRMFECIGRADEAHAVLLVAAKLARLGYASLMCGVMAGRENAPARITAKPLGEFTAFRLMEDLSLLGFEKFSWEALSQLEHLCVPNEYMFSAPLVYLDVLPDGTLGPTLGIELNGIRADNIDDYPQLRLACEWGLADDRWKILRDALFSEDDTFALVPNTLKFRWHNGKPLPAKLYMKAIW